MRIHFVLFFTLFSIIFVTTPSDAAFVNYTDSTGKIHYVNTDYSKVPDQYLNQVADQLKKIEADKIKTLPPIPSSKTPTNSPKIDDIDIVSTATPITSQDRLTRLTNAVNTLQSNNVLPVSVNINSGIINYIDKNGQRQIVTAESLPTVSTEFLPQIDQQIIGLEKIALQIKSDQNLKKNIGPVEVFIKSNCPDCKRLEILLQAHKVKHFIYDVERSDLGIAFYKEMDNAPLPITRIGSKIIHGTNVHAIKQALETDASP